MSNQQTEPSQVHGAPHPPAHQQYPRDSAEQREAKTNEQVRQQKRIYMLSNPQELEPKYRHLPPLPIPQQLPRPPYVVEGIPVHQKDAASTAFYDACSEGNLDLVRAHLKTAQPSAADLAYALEQACQSLQPDVVRFLLQQPNIELHYRCFRRCPDSPGDDLAEGLKAGRSREISQSIFTSGHSRLLDLLKILVEFGWHPNQLLGPPVRGERNFFARPCQDVALHYPRCLLDLDILRFLLDAGADPTIAREIYCGPWAKDIAEVPVLRMSGDILERAVNLGALESVTLLISRGARIDFGIPLHSLVRRRSDELEVKTLDNTHMRELWKETPELEYPTLSTRLTMAGHLLSHGEDINRSVDVFPIIGRYCRVPTRRRIATALSHARDSMDWVMVRWLLENGADPDINGPRDFPTEYMYSIGTSQVEVDDMYHSIVEEVHQEKGSNTLSVESSSLDA